MSQGIIVIGQSHVRALLDGYEAMSRSGRVPPEGIGTSFVVNRPERTSHLTWQGDGYEVDTSVSSPAGVIASHQPARIALAWGGNQMNLRALVATDRPFDVVDPSAETAAPDPSVELIPSKAVDTFVRNRMEENDRFRELLAECNDRSIPVCMLIPPPPLPEDAVRARLGGGPHFARLLDELHQTASEVPLVPGAVRQRLWSVMAGTYRSFSEANELDVLAPPDEAFDSAGMLTSTFWGTDPTHANAAYGEVVLRRAMSWSTAVPTRSPGR